MATLRAPDGCPWDREQTIDTLKPFVLEETYEVLEAIDRHDHARSARSSATSCSRRCSWRSSSPRRALHDRRRGDEHRRQAGAAPSRTSSREQGEAPLDRRPGADAVGRDQGAGAERARRAKAGKPKSLLGGLAPTLPALLRAFHISTRAASVGFDWVAAGDVVDMMQEELDEIRAVVKEGAIDQERAEEEMGDCSSPSPTCPRKLGIEPETALRKANDKFTRRFGTLEQSVAASGRAMKDMTLDQLEAEWQRVKR
jgi:uncharacterized protein YabN with tetrapyrrole methylase and pyrophosphatase domain